MGTGFRADELASLLPTSFDLDAEPPTVVCRAGYTKNGKTATQPLPAEIAEALRGYMADRPAEEPVWPRSWHERGADMPRDDLEAAGIPYVVEGPDGPLHADFHALRHSYVALLDKAGLTLKQAMQLARHSDPKLTMAVYGRAALHDLGAAVDRLPGLVTKGADNLRTTLRPTGTEGAGDAESVTLDVPGLPQLTVPLTGPGVVSRRVVSEIDSAVVSGEEATESSKPRISPGFDGSGRELSSGVVRVGDRTRTGDILIHSPTHIIVSTYPAWA